MPRKLRRYHQAAEEELGEDFELLKPIEHADEGSTLKHVKAVGDDDESDAEDQDLYRADSDSDSAPEDVAFLTSKTSALDRIRSALQQIDGDKAKLKLKRRKQNDLFERQKKLKIGSLDGARLPDDFLEELSEKPVATASPAAASPRTEDVDEETLSITKAAADEASSSGDDSDAELDEDFIPFIKESPGNMRAVCLKEEMLKPKSSAQSAADFRQKALYRPGIPRESTKQKMSKMAKRRARNIT